MIPELDGLITQADVEDLAQSEGLIFDQTRSEILKALRSIDVQACPGSGKTTLIAAKLILLAKKWPFADRGVCVLSHTNVAKDEIIDRLKKSNTTEAQKLLGYPHFIGTIQDFVGKYMALPLIRSNGRSIQMVDTDACVDLIYAKLNYNARTRMDRYSTHSNVLYDFDLNYGGGEISVNVPTFPNGSSSDSFKNLLAVRNELRDTGHFFYADVFAYASKVLDKNESLSVIVQRRFPCVFIDEMQDTQLFQDELLANVFPHGCNDIFIQRFGDPDQAIFHGTGKENPNKSYNNKSVGQMDFVIEKSHRFDNSIGTKTKKFSVNQVPLETESEVKAAEKKEKARGSNSDFEHTIIVFDDDSRSCVVETFAELVSAQFSSKYKAKEKFTVKVVGAVGNEIDPTEDQLKIGHYWSGFDKSKSKKKYTPVSLMDAVYYCRRSACVDWEENYKFLIDSILKALRLSEKRDEKNRHFTATSLREFLELNGHWGYFRKVVYFLLDKNRELNTERWEKVTRYLAKILNTKELSSQANEFMAFSEDVCLSEKANGGQTVAAKNALSLLGANKLLYKDEFTLELSTIHGVKGETHDATLLLETKFHEFDLGTMLQYLADDLAIPTLKRKIKFMRQFYVAMSRPQHLLCLAIHSDRISESDKELLKKNEGWKIKEAGSAQKTKMETGQSMNLRN
jgi:superfamily I DNA/RNA helicase